MSNTENEVGQGENAIGLNKIIIITKMQSRL